MTRDDITQKMRVLFDLIGKAVLEQKDPLDVLETNRTNRKLLQHGKIVVSTILVPAATVTLTEVLKKLLS